MRRNATSFVFIFFLCSAFACTTQPIADDPQIEAAREVTSEAPQSKPTGSLTSDTETAIAAASCPRGLTCYDGCRREHQACHCQNTGWAGYCGFWWDDLNLILGCICD